MFPNNCFNDIERNFNQEKVSLTDIEGFLNIKCDSLKRIFYYFIAEKKKKKDWQAFLIFGITFQ
jgi:hypothetical protein